MHARSGWIVGLMIAAATSVAGATEKIAILDACDPADPRWAPSGGCLLKDGEVDLDEFNALRDSILSTAVVGHPAWRFQPSYAIASGSEKIRAINLGGRGHTFTEVAAFGGGFVPPLSRGLTPAPECLAASVVVIPPGEAVRTAGTLSRKSPVPVLHPSVDAGAGQGRRRISLCVAGSGARGTEHGALLEPKRQKKSPPGGIERARGIRWSRRTLPREGAGRFSPAAQTNSKHASCRRHAFGQLLERGLLRIRVVLAALPLDVAGGGQLAIQPVLSELRSERFHDAPQAVRRRRLISHQVEQGICQTLATRRDMRPAYRLRARAASTARRLRFAN